MENAEPNPGGTDRKARGVRLLVIILIAVGVGASLLYFFSGPEADRFIEDGLVYLENGEEEAALESFQRALAADPENALVLRQLVELIQPEDQEQALEYLLILSRTEEAQLDDRYELVFLAQDLAEYELAGRELAALTRDFPAEPKVLFLLARQAFVEADRERSLARAREAIAADPEMSRAHLLVAYLQLNSQRISDRIEAKNALFRAAEDDGEAGREALLVLTRSPQLPLFPEDREWLADRLESHPLAMPAFFLTAYSQRIMNNPKQRNELIDEAYERFEDTRPGLLANWLNLLGEGARTLELISIEEALESTELFSARLQAMSQTQNLAGAQEMLDSGPEDFIAPQRRSFLLALLALEKGNEDTFVDHWEDAFTSAEEASDWPVLIQLGRISQSRNDFSKMARAFDAAFATGGLDDVSTVEVWEQWLASHLQKGDLDRALEISREIVERFPNLARATNNYAYLRILLDEDTRDAVREIRGLIEQFGMQPEFTTTLALGEMRLGNESQALEALESEPVDWATEGDASLAIYSAVLAANGQEVRARELVAAIDPQGLLAPEQELIAALR